MMKSCLVKANGPSRKMPTSQVKHWKYDSIFKRTLKEINHTIRWSSVAQSHPWGDIAMPVVTLGFGRSWSAIIFDLSLHAWFSTESMHHWQQVGGTSPDDGNIYVQAIIFNQGTETLKITGCLIATAHTVFFNFLTAFPITACFKHTAHSQTVCTKRNIKCSLK